MKCKAILAFLAIFAITFALSTVMAQFVEVTEIEVNGIEVVPNDTSQTISVTASETVPVLVKFFVPDDGNNLTSGVSDVRVKVFIEGFRNEISDSTSRFHVLEGNTYVKRLSLEVPSTLDFDDLTEELNLFVRVSARGEDAVEVFVPLELQKEQHNLNILSIDADSTVVIDKEFVVDVVVENNGHERLDNVYVRASIPGLGVSRQVYAGDLDSEKDVSDDDINDAVNKRLFLKIPRNAAPGNYELEVEAYNADVSVKAVTRVNVQSVETGVLPGVTSGTLAPGEERTFDLVLVNPSDRLVVYTVTPERVKGLIVSVEEPVAAVGPDSSKTVKVRVKAAESAEEGTYVIAVNAISEAGLSKQVSFSVNVEKTSKVTGVTTAVGQTNVTVVLTVVLVIIFVVLVVILIVLVSRRPAEAEEAGETSYY